MCLLINRLGMTLHNAVLYLKRTEVFRGSDRAALDAFRIESELLNLVTVGVADKKNEVNPFSSEKSPERCQVALPNRFPLSMSQSLASSTNLQVLGGVGELCFLQKYRNVKYI